MKSLLLRNGSLPKQCPAAIHGSPKFSHSRHNSISGVFSGERNNSPQISLNSEINHRRRKTTPIGRTLSANDIARSETEIVDGLNKLLTATSRSFPARIPEEEYVLGEDDCGSRFWPENEDLGFEKGMKSGGGNGGGDHGNGGGDHGGDRRLKMGDYYEEMLKSNPGDALLLRNYGKFLEEVEGDRERAEEYYGRAILANPGDGEVLSLYGRLIWDSHRDEERAKSYFDQAVSASPNDCMVMGSYARFMWEAEDEEEINDGRSEVLTPVAPMVAVL